MNRNKLLQYAKQSNFEIIEKSHIGEEWSNTVCANDLSDVEITDQLDQFANIMIQKCIQYIREEYKRDYDIEWREDIAEKIQNHFE